MHCHIEYMADVLTVGDLEERVALVDKLIYPNGTSDRILKSIEFNFPIYRDGREIRKLLWENGNTVETIVLLQRETL